MKKEILSDLLIKSYQDEFAEFDNSLKYKPSLIHRMKMKKLFANMSNSVHTESMVEIKRTRFRPQLVLIIILIAVLFISVASVSVFRISDYLGITTPKHTFLTFNANTENCPRAIESIYVLKAIPDGFEYVDGGGEIGDSMVSAIYWNEKTEQGIEFVQTVKNRFRNIEFNTEKYTLKETTVNDCPGILSSSEIDGHNWYHLIWDNGDYILELSFSYHPCDSELQKIVDNIAIKQAL